MNKIFIAFFVLWISCLRLGAQTTPFFTHDSVDINNIHARVLVHGDMWWDPAVGLAACYFPAGSGKNINFAGALWMSGFDESGSLHVAAQTYRQVGNDYWPGPVDSTYPITYAASQNWAHIWKVNRTDITYFQSLSTHTIANTPQAILTWPARGNINAAGNGGAVLVISEDMAPFVDLNGDGVYEPLLGEYPAIEGDQALWWVFSDNGPAHTETNGQPLGVEIHALAYAYKRGTLIDNVIYYDYNIINRSGHSYSNFRLGQWDDMDLGYFQDDYIGFDSSHRMGITYNGTNDDGGSAGHPINSYGTHMPIAGITMIILPGDTRTSLVPAGSFTTYDNDGTVWGNPTGDTQYNHYLRSENRFGTHFTNTFGGAGTPCLAMGLGPNTNYLYTGEPSNPEQWSECGCGNIPGDRRFIITSNDFTLAAGGSQHVLMALVTTNLDTNNGCPTAKFDSIKVVADTAWNRYFNSLPPEGVNSIAAANSISIYPNPAHDRLIIANTGITTGDETIIIYNTLGQALDAHINKSGQKLEADISKLPTGLYLLLYRTGTIQKTVKFLKE